MHLSNAGQLLTERAKVSPQLEALVDLGTGCRLTFRTMNEGANQISHALAASGLKPGDRLAVLMGNCGLYVQAFYGAAKAGLVFVALNWRLTVPELSYQLADCGARAVIYTRDQLALVEPLMALFPDVRWLAIDDGAFAIAIAEAAQDEPTLGAGGQDPLFIMYTSGTTGKPKGAVLCHEGSIEWSHRALATADSRYGERGLIVAPLFHIGGLGMAITYVHRGITSVIAQAFDPKLAWGWIEAERITNTFMVPAMLNFMIQHPARLSHDYSTLRSILCGAAPVPVSMIEAYAALGIDIHQVYGATETHGGICLLGPEYARSKAGSTGLPYFGMDVRVVDGAGRDVPPGVPGEVITRGPHVLKEYWNKPEETAAALRDGWFYLGDIAEVDAEGFIYIKDRSKDMIISGGENIYPAEIEDVILQHPAVREVAVIGQPSARWGESPAAILVRKDEAGLGLDALVASIQAHCATRLARYKQPRSFAVVDSIPRNPSGKILKRLLREQFPGPAPE